MKVKHRETICNYHNHIPFERLVHFLYYVLLWCICFEVQVASLNSLEEGTIDISYFHGVFSTFKTT